MAQDSSTSDQRIREASATARMTSLGECRSAPCNSPASASSPSTHLVARYEGQQHPDLAVEHHGDIAVTNIMRRASTRAGPDACRNRTSAQRRGTRCELPARTVVAASRVSTRLCQWRAPAFEPRNLRCAVPAPLSRNGSSQPDHASSAAASSAWRSCHGNADQHDMREQLGGDRQRLGRQRRAEAQRHDEPVHDEIGDDAIGDAGAVAALSSRSGFQRGRAA